MKLFLNINPKLLAESQIQSSVQIDEIDAIADTLDSNINKEIRIPKDVLDSFLIKDKLNPDIWTNDELNPEIRVKLIKIATDFFKDLNLPKEIQIKDIIFTGSLANYNWSRYSDVDLHIVLDFKQFEVDEQLLEDYFWAQKALWNQEHDITIYKFPIELYVQDINAKLVATAVYSILNDKWLKKPVRESFKLDTNAIKTKANAFIKKLRGIKQDYKDKEYQSVVDKVTNIKDKIKNMRNAGLEKGGEFSIENLVFKTLRRTPFMDIIDSYKAKSYDELMSINELNQLHLDETEKSDNSTFKYRTEGDEILINAIYNDEKIGKLSMLEMHNAYYYFEKKISKEKYDELFPEDKFILISWIETYLNSVGQGIGKKLMTLALQKAKELGFNTVFLNASPISHKRFNINDLVGFYESFGFKVFLNEDDNVLMTLRLK
jgi:GNAT superfamily N-acetyltransferase